MSALRINVWALSNEWYTIPIEYATVWRPNYPYNCFTLDLSDNKEVKEKGLKQIFFYFHSINGTSAEILLGDKTLTCSREIKDNKFYFSGPSLEVEDLGK